MCVCLLLIAFARENMWHTAKLMGYLNSLSFAVWMFFRSVVGLKKSSKYKSLRGPTYFKIYFYSFFGLTANIYTHTHTHTHTHTYIYTYIYIYIYIYIYTYIYIYIYIYIYNICGTALIKNRFKKWRNHAFKKINRSQCGSKIWNNLV